MLNTVDFNDLRKMGFPENQARRIIRMAKKNLVSKGYGFYNGRRVGRVPISAVAEIIGIPLDRVEKGDRNGN